MDDLTEIDRMIRECGADLPTEPALNAEEQAAKDLADLYSTVDELDAFFAAG